MSKNHIPKNGDKVNDNRRIPHANGTVVRILYDDGPDEVVVKFDNGIEVYDYDEFRHTWTDRYGGVFLLNGETFWKKPTSGALI